jgi:hypothetical protein
VIVSRRRLEERVRSLATRNEALIADRDAWKADADATGRALGQVAGELSRAKDVIASRIAAAGHPSTAWQSPQAFADALQQALTDAGVDLQIEFARLEGADL